MNIKAVIWDLDGTLLNTLDDLAASVNAALAMNGMPLRSTEEVRAFVGNGIRNLMIRAVPGGEANPAFDKALEDFIRHYGAHSRDRTRPYDGILEMLDRLSAAGVKHAIVSNKIDFAVKALSRAYFGERMCAAIGDDPSRARKPAPDSVLAAMREMGVTAQETVYVGDSDVDVLTARNAGVPCVAVLWGFRDEACLRAAGAGRLARTPDELREIIERL
ncbi:MAG: HAD-IA family hydrolase [Candidatus Ventricola sp.]|nr:HAD-IA family hydrolase [Candidatus Ventricola sp.]